MVKQFRNISSNDKTNNQNNKTKYNSFLKLAICKLKYSNRRDLNPLEIRSNKFDEIFSQKLQNLTNKYKLNLKTDFSDNMQINSSETPNLKSQILNHENKQIISFKKNKILNNFFKERRKQLDALIYSPKKTKSFVFDSSSDFHLTSFKLSSPFTNKNKYDYFNFEFDENDSYIPNIFNIEREDSIFSKKNQKLGKDSKGLRQMSRSLIIPNITTML